MLWSMVHFMRKTHRPHLEPSSVIPRADLAWPSHRDGSADWAKQCCMVSRHLSQSRSLPFRGAAQASIYRIYVLRQPR